ncbi:MAG: hypothetical protein N2509_00025 [Treponemataceae bacterium]|nr:hypothetical protein [Treponemataceae bacterium]
MKSLSDYTSSTAATELYAFLAELVVNEEVTSFSQLMELVEKLPRDNRFMAIIPRIFKLIQKLQWGFFRDIDPEQYPKIWKEVVVPHPEFKQCGDLKRNLTISDIYVGILDLHGYTRFCEKNKNNLSMLQMLDDLIQVDLLNIAKKYNVVFQRRQGDEMVLVGASAADVLAVTLLVIQAFSKQRTIHFKGDDALRTGNSVILEEMHVSAGIAGGKKFTPFIITKDGDLSGGVINTAARLQGRANELSSTRSCIIVSRTVYSSFVSEMKVSPHPFFSKVQVKFFDSGWISFKGISVAVHEVLFTSQDMNRLLYEEQFQSLYKAIDNGAWKDGIFISLMHLLMKIFKVIPKFRITVSLHGKNEVLENEDCIKLAQDTANLFRITQNYGAAIASLGNLVECIEAIPNFDRLCLEYSRCIYAAYKEVQEEFEKRVDEKIEEKIPQVLPAKYKAAYEEGKRGAEVYQRLKERVFQTLTPLELSLLWSTVVDGSLKNKEISIHSGKK